MARFTGKKGALYVARTSGGSASPLLHLRSWKISKKPKQIDVTAMDDDNEVLLGGISSASGSYTGWMDSTANGAYDAASDGLPRKFYLYPDHDNLPSVYHYGTAIFDYEESSAHDGAPEVSGEFAGAGPILRSV